MMASATISQNPDFIAFTLRYSAKFFSANADPEFAMRLTERALGLYHPNHPMRINTLKEYTRYQNQFELLLKEKNMDFAQTLEPLM